MWRVTREDYHSYSSWRHFRDLENRIILECDTTKCTKEDIWPQRHVLNTAETFLEISSFVFRFGILIFVWPAGGAHPYLQLQVQASLWCRMPGSPWPVRLCPAVVECCSDRREAAFLGTSALKQQSAPATRMKQDECISQTSSTLNTQVSYAALRLWEPWSKRHTRRWVSP